MTSFTPLDYAIFALYLAASVGLGLFCVRGQNSVGEYFLAGRDVNRYVVAMTVLAALFSGISYIAAPAEVYRNGFAFAWAVLAFFIATPFTAIFMLPHFYQSRFFTAYQYLEERFSPRLKLLASGLFILRVALWLAAATYAPALALEQVTGLPLWFTILCTGIGTSIYTVFGGMKAVIWTDVMQLIVLVGGQLVIVLVATGKVPGGLGGVWQTAMEDHRFAISFDLSLTQRVTFWGVLIGAPFMHLVQMATDQVSVQRYLTAGSLREAQRSLWIKLWFLLPVVILFYGAGLVLYAFYKVQGDPLSLGQIKTADQILPYFVVHELPAGLPGLLIAAIFAASMSTVSAGLNSLASATLMDFELKLGAQSSTEEGKVRTARWVTFGYGLLVTGLAFAVDKIGGNLVESVNSIIGLVGGPMLGLFFLGMFTRRATSTGAMLGTLAGFLALLALHFSKARLPISFLWYALIGAAVTMAVGMLVSVLAPTRRTS
jgi:sodium-coupled monocarboxylate transporter 8/12